MRSGCFFKAIDKRTGWYGEACWAQEGKKFLKRLEHRYNRRALKKQLKKELNND